MRERELATFDENRRAVGMLNPMRDKNVKMKARTGGKKGRHLSPRLVQKIAEGKTSYELTWKVKSDIYYKKKKSSRCVSPHTTRIDVNGVYVYTYYTAVYICIVKLARKSKIPPAPRYVRVAQGGVCSSKHEKHHQNVYRSAQVITLFFFQMLLFASCSQKSWNSCSSLPGCCGLHTKNVTAEFESPWDLRQGFFFFFTNSTNWLEYGQKYGSGRPFCSSSYAIIVCGILESTTANASSHSYAQGFFWNSSCKRN